MKLNVFDVNGRDVPEKFYIFFLEKVDEFKNYIIPYFRHALRFLFLPYAFFYLINWHVCNEKKSRVFLDFLYIFFKLKTFPDHYQQCRLWEKPRSQWSLYWGSNYNPFQRRSLRRSVQQEKYIVLYEDKLLCQNICELNGISTPKCYGVIDAGEDIIERLKGIVQDHDLQNAGVVLKPVDGKGGHNISFYSIGSDRQVSFEYSSGNRVKLAQTRFIVQEVVTQDSYVNKLSRSINTVRFVTALDDNGKAFTVGAYLRIGVDESFVDNLSRGGVAVNIDITQGKLLGHPVNIHAEAIRSHDDLNELISNFHIPYWNEVVALAHEVQEKISYHRLLGMDIAISSNGPVVIEVNSIYDNTGLEMVCGPMFSDKKVVDFFESNSLLFCEKQIKEINKFHENVNHVN